MCTQIIVGRRINIKYIGVCARLRLVCAHRFQISLAPANFICRILFIYYYKISERLMKGKPRCGILNFQHEIKQSESLREWQLTCVRTRLSDDGASSWYVFLC